MVRFCVFVAAARTLVTFGHRTRCLPVLTPHAALVRLPTLSPDATSTSLRHTRLHAIAHNARAAAHRGTRHHTPLLPYLHKRLSLAPLGLHATFTYVSGAVSTASRIRHSHHSLPPAHSPPVTLFPTAHRHSAPPAVRHNLRVVVPVPASCTLPTVLFRCHPGSLPLSPLCRPRTTSGSPCPGSPCVRHPTGWFTHHRTPFVYTARLFGPRDRTSRTGLHCGAFSVGTFTLGLHCHPGCLDWFHTFCRTLPYINTRYTALHTHTPAVLPYCRLPHS